MIDSMNSIAATYLRRDDTRAHVLPSQKALLGGAGRVSQSAGLLYMVRTPVFNLTCTCPFCPPDATASPGSQRRRIASC